MHYHNKVMIENIENFSILVNTTDSFEDCWFPFFKLFKKYWSDHTGKIYLNTEEKIFTYPPLHIVSIQNNIYRCHKKIAWSESLIRALDYINTDIILYLQEDYFLTDYVDNKKISYFASLLKQNNYSCIHLTGHATSGPILTTNNPYLWKISQKAPYRISTQAALWNKSSLKFYLRKKETPWEFEVLGTKRAHKIKDEIYCVNLKIFNKNNSLIPYTATGIVKGKWNKDKVCNLFMKNEINIDFQKRGFYKKHNRNRNYNFFEIIRFKIKYIYWAFIYRSIK